MREQTKKGGPRQRGRRTGRQSSTGSAPSRCTCSKGRSRRSGCAARRSRSRLARSRRGHGLLLPRCLVRKERVQRLVSPWRKGQASRWSPSVSAWQRQAELARRPSLNRARHSPPAGPPRRGRPTACRDMYPENSPGTLGSPRLSSSFSWLSRGSRVARVATSRREHPPRLGSAPAAGRRTTLERRASPAARREIDAELVAELGRHGWSQDVSV